MDSIKLDIGSGGKASDKLGDGWLGVDPYTSEADVQADMWDLPYPDNSVERIYSSHALEHVSKYTVPRALKEWCRVLEPYGTCIIRVPDLEWCVKHWLKHKDNGWSLDIIYGSQEHDGMVHRTGFTEQLLVAYVKEAGFSILKTERLWTNSQLTLSIECTKG